MYIFVSQGCINYITSIVREGDKVGIVKFNSFALAVKELTLIDASSRTILTSSVPLTANGGTNIGAGTLL